MKIPKDPAERLAFYQDLTQKIFASAEERRSFYAVMRAYVRDGGLFSADNYPIFNNLGAHLELVASMVYAQDTTRFSINPDATEDASVYPKLPIASQRVQQEWHDSNCDTVIGDAVLSALGDASAIVKMVWNNGLHPYPVMPENFGVLREDVAMLSRQQALGERYRITESALRTMLMVHPRSEQIMFRISWSQRPELVQEANEGARGVFMSSFDAQGSMVGNAGMPSTTPAEPNAKTNEPMCDLLDLWIWDDDASDYWVVTMADPDVVIYERHADDGREKTLYLKGEHPYIQLCPNSDANYFWGRSEAARLRPLQDWLTERLWGIRRMMKRQANPPKVGSGLYGDDAEVAEALTTPGNYVPGDVIAGFKIEELKPVIPDDLFRDVTNILEMFNMVSGTPKSLQGQGEAGVRSENHAFSLIRTGSTRIKRKALKIEDALNRAATLIFKLLKKYCADQLIDTESKPFILAQIGEDVEVQVDAHSSSPAFMDDLRQWAADMFKAGLLDSDGYFNLTNPPQRELLKARARELSKARAQAAAKERQEEKVIELAKIRSHAGA